MTLQATAFWAALLAPLCLWLSMRVIGLRRQLKVAIGTGGQPAIERAMRAQANFAEYVPFALVLIGLAEAGGTPGWIIHPLGAALVAGRVAHAWGITREREDFRFRVGGMMATFTVIGCAALAAMVSALT
jgi:hypothetical protein